MRGNPRGPICSWCGSVDEVPLPQQAPYPLRQPAVVLGFALCRRPYCQPMNASSTTASRFRLPFALSHLAAGFVAVLVGYTSSVAIIFQAAQAAGATAQELASWMWALGIGMGVTCIGLSLYFRTPILTAWSTPGAALLVTALDGLNMSQAIGVFLLTSLLLTLAGATGTFQRLMAWVPRHLAGAMLAGILVRFGMDAFGAMH